MGIDNAKPQNENESNSRPPAQGGRAVRDFFAGDAELYDARHYGSRYRTFIGDRQTLVIRVLRSVELPRSPRILDVACGPGHFLHVALQDGAQPVGIDSSPAMLEASRARLGEQARLVRGNALVLPFASDTFDLVNCSGLIEYLPEPLPMLREFHRVLKVGGRAIVSSTNRRSPAVVLSPIVDAVRNSAMLRTLVRTLRPQIEEIALRERRFRMTFHTPKQLSDLLTAVGFGSIEIHYCHLQLLPHPLDRVVPAMAKACVTVTDRFLGVPGLRALAEGLLAVGRRHS